MKNWFKIFRFILILFMLAFAVFLIMLIVAYFQVYF